MTRYTNAHLLRHLVLKMHHVTKAGSGQSKKTQKEMRFLAVPYGHEPVGAGLVRAAGGAVH